jgi:hypothetical protein
MRVSAKLAALEIRGDVVRVAAVRTGSRKPQVLELHAERAVYETPEQQPEALAAAVRAAMDRLKTRPAAVVLSMSCEWTIVRLLTLPLTGSKRVGAAVPFELEPYLAFPIEDLVVDHAPIRVANGQTQVLAVGVRRTTLEEHLATLEAAGLEVDGVDVDAVGLSSLWHAGHGKQRGLHAALHVRPEDAVLTIAEGKKLAYFRLLPVGSTRLQENPKAVARDVVNSLRSFTAAWNKEIGAEAERETVQSLTVSGVELFEEERALLEAELGLPVSFEDMLQHVKGSEKALAKVAAENGALAANTWSSVIGAANAAAGEPYAFNFRKQEYKPASPLRGLRPQVVFSALLAAVLVVGFGVYTYMSYNRNMAEARRLGAAMWEEYASAFPESAEQTPRSSNDLAGAFTYQRMREERDAWYSRGVLLSLDMFTRPTALDILAELAKAMPGDQIDLKEVRIAPGRAGRNPEITISGEANNAAAVDAAEAALRASSIIKMRPESIQRSSAGTRENFTIRADL